MVSRVPLLLIFLASVISPGLRSELIAHWTFNTPGAEVIDQVGGLRGSAQNVAFINGVDGLAASFNGNSSYIRVSNSSSRLALTNSPYSFVWRQRGGTTHTTRYQHIFSTDRGVDYRNGWAVYGDVGQLGWNHNNGSDQHWDTGVFFSAVEWRDYALTWDGTTQRVYVDGQLKNSTSATGNLAYGGADFMIGAIDVRGQLVNYFNGEIDDLRIYNHALSLQEVQKISPPIDLPSSLTRALVGRYPLDGNAADTSGNSLHGTISGATPTTNRWGMVDGALRFNGLNAFVDLGNPSAFQFTNGFTLSAWVRRGPAFDRYIIAKYNDPSDQALTPSPNSYGLAVGTFHRPYAFVSPNQPTYSDLYGSSSIPAGVWTQVTFVFDNTFGISLFQNGSVVGSRRTANHPPFTNSVPLFIGRSLNGQFFDGDIDDVRLYARPMSSAEVRYLYEQENIPPVVAGPVVTIHSHPVSRRIATNESGHFAVAVSGPASMTFQWELNGAPISGATEAVYATPQGLAPGSYIYRVRIRSGSSEVVSDPAELTVVADNSDRRLVARWAFDEVEGSVALDSLGRYTGALTGGGRVTRPRGGGAIRFDGVDDYIRIPNPGADLALTNTPYTVMWWQRWDGKTSHPHQHIIAFDDGSDFSGGYGAYLRASEFSTPFAIFQHNSGAENSLMTHLLHTNLWQHFAVIWDGTTQRFYVDGHLTRTNALSVPIKSDGDDAFTIGAQQTPTQTRNFFRGDLDEIRIYNAALSHEEIIANGPPPSIIFTNLASNFRVLGGRTQLIRNGVIAQGGVEPITFQWTVNGEAIEGATNLVLQAAPTTPGEYVYRLEASGIGLSVTSEPVVLTVVQPYEAGLLAHWTFDELEDAIIAEETGTFDGLQTNAKIDAGRVGLGSLRFDGSASVTVSNAAALDLIGTPYTVAWWMRSEAPMPGAPLFGMFSPDGTSSAYSVSVSGTQVTARHGAQTVSANLPSSIIDSWNHFALVFDGARLTLYTNGAVAAIANATVPILQHNHDLFSIGNTQQGSQGFVGLLDDLRIYTYALAASEVRELILPVPARSLNIQRIAGTAQLRLSWQHFDEEVFRLESAASLSGPWAPVGGLPVRVGTASTQTIAEPTSTRFYRLRQL